MEFEYKKPRLDQTRLTEVLNIYQDIRAGFISGKSNDPLTQQLLDLINQNEIDVYPFAPSISDGHVIVSENAPMISGLIDRGPSVIEMQPFLDAFLDFQEYGDLINQNRIPGRNYDTVRVPFYAIYSFFESRSFEYCSEPQIDFLEKMLKSIKDYAFEQSVARIHPTYCEDVNGFRLLLIAKLLTAKNLSPERRSEILKSQNQNIIKVLKLKSSFTVRNPYMDFGLSKLIIGLSDTEFYEIFKEFGTKRAFTRNDSMEAELQIIRTRFSRIRNAAGINLEKLFSEALNKVQKPTHFIRWIENLISSKYLDDTFISNILRQIPINLASSIITLVVAENSPRRLDLMIDELVCIAEDSDQKEYYLHDLLQYQVHSYTYMLVAFAAIKSSTDAFEYLTQDFVRELDGYLTQNQEFTENSSDKERLVLILLTGIKSLFDDSGEISEEEYSFVLELVRTAKEKSPSIGRTLELALGLS